MCVVVLLFVCIFFFRLVLCVWFRVFVVFVFCVFCVGCCVCCVVCSCVRFGVFVFLICCFLCGVGAFVCFLFFFVVVWCWYDVLFRRCSLLIV